MGFREASNLSSATKTQMFREILEQPENLERLWIGRNDFVRLAKKVSKSSMIYFTAFGSSYNAALYAQYLLYHFLGLPSVVATPTFFLNPRKKLREKAGLAIAISQSGKVHEVILAIQALRKAGLQTLAITNNANSDLAKNCHDVLPLQAGPEKSVPATKTFTATLFSLQLLVAHWGAKSMLRGLSQTPSLCQKILEGTHEMKLVASRLGTATRGFVLAPEALRPIALEGSLKLNECAYLMAEPFEWKEFFHGPVALAERETPALLLRQPDDLKSSFQVEKLLKKIGVRSLPIGLERFKEIKDSNMAAIPFTLLFQLIAHHLALLRGRNPDHPRHLQKVTQTPIG